MAEFDVRIFGGQFNHHIAPEHRCLEDIGLIDRTQFLAALLRRNKGLTADAPDLGFVVNVGIEAFSITLGIDAHATWLTKIDAPGQLADDQQIQTRHQFRLQ